MKAITTYLCSDGVPHIFDAADRQVPLCEADVFVVSQNIGSGDLPACEACAGIVLAVVKGRC